MWKYTFLAVLILLLTNLIVINFWAYFSFKSHKICLDLFNKNLTTSEIYQSSVCNEKPSLPSLNHEFLLPLMTVSGLPLVLGEALTIFLLGSRSRSARILLFLLAALLSLATRCPPGLTRAWLQTLPQNLSREERLNWPVAAISLLTGLLCTLLKPLWLVDRGFLICWVAALALRWPVRRWPARLAVLFLATGPLITNAPATSFGFSTALSVLLFYIKPIYVGAAYLSAPLVLMNATIDQAMNHFWTIANDGLAPIVRIVSASPFLEATSSKAPAWVFFYALAFHALHFAVEVEARKKNFWAAQIEVDQ